MEHQDQDNEWSDGEDYDYDEEDEDLDPNNPDNAYSEWMEHINFDERIRVEKDSHHKKVLYDYIQELENIYTMNTFQIHVPKLPITLTKDSYPYAELAKAYPVSYKSILYRFCLMQGCYVYPIIEILAEHSVIDNEDIGLVTAILRQALISGSNILFGVAMRYIGKDFHIDTYLPKYVFPYLLSRKDYMEDPILQEEIENRRIAFLHQYIRGKANSIVAEAFHAACSSKLYSIAEYIATLCNSQVFEIPYLNEQFVFACKSRDMNVISMFKKLYKNKYMVLRLPNTIVTNSSDNVIIPIHNTNLKGVILSDKNARWEYVRPLYKQSHYIPNDVIHYISEFCI